MWIVWIWSSEAKKKRGKRERVSGTDALPFIVFLVQASYVKLIFHPISAHRLSLIVCICAVSPSEPSRKGVRGG